MAAVERFSGMKTYLVALTQFAASPYIKIFKEAGLTLPNTGIDTDGMSPFTPVGILSLMDGENNPTNTRRRMFQNGNLGHISATILAVGKLPDSIHDFQIMQNEIGTLISGDLLQWFAFMSISPSLHTQKVAEFADSVVEHFVFMGVPELCKRRIR